MSEKIAVRCNNIGCGEWRLNSKSYVVDNNCSSYMNISICNKAEPLKPKPMSEKDEGFKIGDRVEWKENEYIIYFKAGDYSAIKLPNGEDNDSNCESVHDNELKLLATNNQTTKEDTMKKAIEDNFEKTKDANLVEAELPGGKLNDFLSDHLVKIYAKEILAEAKRLKKEREDS